MTWGGSVRASRRGGALALRPCDLDRQRCLVLLWEKGHTQRWQPVSPTLMQHLTTHAAERQYDGDDVDPGPASVSAVRSLWT
jgi:integrase/recombinase XerC